MSEYIKREELIDNIVRIDDLRRLNTKTIGEAIDKTTSIDIVRCKDCIYYHPSDNVEDITCEFGRRVGDGGYCSYGERKDD